jgi:hypothetical protein
MARIRSISDREIALIKALIKTGMKNKDIQFLFNRPDRPVNSGRISGIAKGDYGESKDIPEATEKDIEEFLEGFSKNSTGISVSLSNGEIKQMNEPISEKVILDMFQEDELGFHYFKFSESDRHECKQDFGFKFQGKWLRAVAALANNGGGYIVFGVRDRKSPENDDSIADFRVDGMGSDEFRKADPADFTKIIKSTFDPTPRVETSVVQVGTKTVGVMYVHQHISRPVIATKNVDDQIKEGDIFFRYSGMSARIKYSDLRGILDDRDRQAREQILPMVEKLLALGPRNAMVADLATGTLGDATQSIVIGEDLLEKIKFIREGEFNESDGAPTLKLIGTVEALNSNKAIVQKSFVTVADLIKDFLNEEKIHDACEYIRCAVELSNGAWVPLHYFARIAGLNRPDLVDFINSTDATASRKALFARRALMENTAYLEATGAAHIYLRDLSRGVIPEVRDFRTAVDFARAMAALQSRPNVEIASLLASLKKCWEIIERKRPNRLSDLRKGIARIDELYFSQ